MPDPKQFDETRKVMELAKTRAMLEDIAAGLDALLNPDQRGKARKNAFVLLVTPFSEVTGKSSAEVNYVSNAERDDIIVIMRNVVERFDAQKKMATPSAMKN